MELPQWVKEGIIDSSQEQNIKSRYKQQLEYNRLINTIVTLGSILIGLGILLFVASNWDKLNLPLKITLIFSIIALFNILGYYFRSFKNNLIGIGEGALLIGSFAFGAGIWLIAQIYQIHYNFSSGLIFWILGTLPIAYIYRSSTILILNSILSFIWLNSYKTYYPERTAYGFFLLIALILPLVYLRKQKFSLFMLILGLSTWLTFFWQKTYFMNLGLLLWDTNNLNLLTLHLLLTTIYSIFGFILYGLGIWNQRSQRFGIFSFLYKFLGVIFITIACYSLTFSHHYDKYAIYKITTIPIGIKGLIVILSLLIISIFHKMRSQSLDKHESREINLTFKLFTAQMIALFLALYWPKTTSLDYNIILITQTLIFMYLGFLRHSEGIFRLAIVIFFLNILTRYFDIFWKMMPRSLLFILGGIILILGATFANRKRKEIETKMKVENITQ